MNTYHDSLLKLVGLSNFLEQQTGLDECLNDLAEMAAGILEVRNCSIMLFHHEKEPGEFRLRVFAQCGPLPEIARHEAANINGGIAGQVASKGEPLLVEDITQTAFFPLARRPDEPSKSFISVPIGIAGTVIGIINSLGNAVLFSGKLFRRLTCKLIPLIPVDAAVFFYFLPEQDP